MVSKAADRERLAESCLGTVYDCAGRVGGHGFTFDDLVSAGFEGLTHALNGYNPTRGTAKFNTYAHVCILRLQRHEARRIRKHAVSAGDVYKADEEGLTAERGFPLDGACGVDVHAAMCALTVLERDVIRQLYWENQTAADVQRHYQRGHKWFHGVRNVALLKLSRLLKSYNDN